MSSVAGVFQQERHLKFMEKYKKIEKCVVCGNTDSLNKYIDFGLQPLANSYHKGVCLDFYPLAVQFCAVCSHNQLTVSVNPDEMFSHYLYVSDTSQTLTEYFQQLCNKILERNSEKNLDVFEIACNSGLFLEMFSKAGMTCLGIDPAQNLREMSSERNLDVIVDFWNEDLAEKIAQEKSFDIVLAIHVLPHVPDPVSFLKACNKVLKEKGKVYIQTSQCNMFLNNEFDAIYHEHVSYFTAISFGRAAQSAGFKITGAWKAPVHSMSFVFELVKNGENCKDYLDMVFDEIDMGRHQLHSHTRFAENAHAIKNDLQKTISDFKSKNIKVVGYGASAKGNTLLNWLKIKLDYIVDDNNLKWGYLTPGCDIPIVAPSQLYSENKPVAIVCLAWNFYDEIYQNVVRNTTVPHSFIKYFPVVEVCS